MVRIFKSRAIFAMTGAAPVPGAAAHTRGNEQKVGVFDRFGESFFALFRGSPAHFGIGSRAQSFQ